MHYIDRKGSECILSGCCLTIILAVAAWQDYREYKVKNCIILTGWILGLLCGIYYRGLTGMICFLCNSVISVFILLFLFLLCSYYEGYLPKSYIFMILIDTYYLLNLLITELDKLPYLHIYQVNQYNNTHFSS